jgi:hypothetical protein
MEYSLVNRDKRTVKQHNKLLQHKYSLVNRDIRTVSATSVENSRNNNKTVLTRKNAKNNNKVKRPAAESHKHKQRGFWSHSTEQQIRYNKGGVNKTISKAASSSDFVRRSNNKYHISSAAKCCISEPIKTMQTFVVVVF